MERSSWPSLGSLGSVCLGAGTSGLGRMCLRSEEHGCHKEDERKRSRGLCQEQHPACRGPAGRDDWKWICLASCRASTARVPHDTASHKVFGEIREDIHWKASFHPWDLGPLFVPGPGPWGPDLSKLGTGTSRLEDAACGPAGLVDLGVTPQRPGPSRRGRAV